MIVIFQKSNTLTQVDFLDLIFVISFGERFMDFLHHVFSSFIIPCILSVPIILENEDKRRQVQNMSHVKDWCCFLKFWIKYSVTVIFDTQTGYKRTPGNYCFILPVLTPACLSLCLSLITMVTCLCVPECFARFEWYPPWCFACDYIHHSP